MDHTEKFITTVGTINAAIWELHILQKWPIDKIAIAVSLSTEQVEESIKTLQTTLSASTKEYTKHRLKKQKEAAN